MGGEGWRHNLSHSSYEFVANIYCPQACHPNQSPKLLVGGAGVLLLNIGQIINHDYADWVLLSYL